MGPKKPSEPLFRVWVTMMRVQETQKSYGKDRDIKTNQNDLTNREARFQYYIACDNETFEGIEQGYRMQLGWYIENIARTTFPENDSTEYTGLKYHIDICPYKKIPVIPMSCTRNK